MHSYTYALLAFGALLLPASAIPAPAPQQIGDPYIESAQPVADELNQNRPVCSNTDPRTGQAFVLLDGVSSMQEQCVGQLRATCAGVVTFPTSTSNGTGNPDNCGEACNCNQSTCGTVPVSCDAPACHGARNIAAHQSIGSCNPGLGQNLGGCPCTV